MEKELYAGFYFTSNPPNSALGSKAAGFPITRDHPITGSPDSSA
jgi:hypothetical protein